MGSLLRQREVVNFKFQVRWWKGRCDNRHVSSGAQKEKKEFLPFDLPNTGRAPVPAEIRSHSKGPSKSIN